MSDIKMESADDPRMIGEYRPFSAICAVALLVGLVSCVAVLNTGLAFLGGIAAAFCLIALLRVRMAQYPMSGARLAYIGLFLSLFSLTYAASHRYLRHEHMQETARKYADQWLDMVRTGDVHRTYEMTLNFSKRQSPEIDLKYFYDNLTLMPNSKGENRVHFDSYTTVEPEVTLRRDGADCELIFEGITNYQWRLRSESFFLAYLLKPADPKAGDRRFKIEMRRDVLKEPWGPQWTVAGIENYDPRLPRELREMLIEE